MKGSVFMDKFETKKNNTAADNSAAEEKTAIEKTEETQLIAEPLETLGVTISAERYAELIRAEHNCQLIKKAFGVNSLFKYESDRENVISLLLGTKVIRS